MKTVKPKIPFAWLIGILGATILMLFGAYLEGSPLMAFLNLPAFLIVGGGTTGAVLAHAGISKFMKAPQGIKNVLSAEEPDWESTAIELVRAAEIARREGLLRLEDEAKNVEDPFIKQAYQLLADGTERDVMLEILDRAIESEHNDLKAQAEIFTAAGGYSPTMGIIGTVMGLTHALGLLNEPEKLGPAIAGAFMATLYGVSSGNLVFLPTGNRLTAMGKEREAFREMILTAAVSIQRGDQSRVVAEKLVVMLPAGNSLTGDDLRDRAREGI